MVSAFNLITFRHSFQRTAIQRGVIITTNLASGKICPYCMTVIKDNDEVVICPECEMPHHKECWNENSGCTTFGCQGQTSSVYMGAIIQPSQAPQTTLNICTKCGWQLTVKNNFCPRCGTIRNNQEVLPECDQCGYILKNNQNFCPKCGSSRLRKGA